MVIYSVICINSVFSNVIKNYYFDTTYKITRDLEFSEFSKREDFKGFPKEVIEGLREAAIEKQKQRDLTSIKITVLNNIFYLLIGLIVIGIHLLIIRRNPTS